MQTNFSLAQMADPHIAEADKILRACVHCGFCLATCPTYLLLGDERDSPRGRIYLMKEMFERGEPAGETVTRHIDRCLSCLSCMTTCPSGVNYMHLVDHARAHIEQTYQRRFIERLQRAVLAAVLPRPWLFRLALRAAGIARLASPVLPESMRRWLALGPARLLPASPVDRPQVFPAEGKRRARVALLSGCVQTVLDPAINEATVRLLTRHGCEVVVVKGVGCCGAMDHHLGRESNARALVKAAVAAWAGEADANGLDAIIVNASGCGTMVKDYGFLLRDDATYAERAAKVSALARDVSEYLATLELQPTGNVPRLKVAYHAACSLSHGQGVTEVPKQLLAAQGFVVSDIAEGHLCCGSAGTYNLLQPELARQLLVRKAANIVKLAPDVVAMGNIGCMVQIASALPVPVVHTVELLDWATGGPRPPGLAAVGTQ
jgi:glycolate oxidase iron-sulfur subunit